VRARTPVVVRAIVRVRRNGRLTRVRGARVLLAGARGRTNRRGVARLRKRFGFNHARRYRVRALHPRYRTGTAVVRSR